MSTIEDVRTQLQAVLDAAAADTAEVDCPMCHGTGRVMRTHRRITQNDVAQAIGVPRTSIVTFLAGRQGLKMDATLRLLDWLDNEQPEAPVEGEPR